LVRLHFGPRLPRSHWLTIVFTAILAFTAPGATAAGELGVEARVGFGFSQMLSKWQQDEGYRSGYVPEVRPGLRLGSAIATELMFASWFFPRADSGTGRATLLGAGLRWDPRLRTWLTWFLDGHGGLALTGPANRFMLDAGTGFDIWVTDNLAFGLFLRYGQVVGRGADPVFWAGGFGATMTFASTGDKPSGVVREERQRAREVTRVEARPVERDSDGDGVPDREDRCPDQPFGKNPDPLSLGCPLSDADHDGIPDILDACPKKRGKPSPRPRQNGCAPGGSLPPRPAPFCRSDASA
jgi:hypothetical protein